jgi:hypothetical protein
MVMVKVRARVMIRATVWVRFSARTRANASSWYSIRPGIVLWFRLGLGL